MGVGMFQRALRRRTATPQPVEVEKIKDGHTCSICNKSLKTPLALAGHMRSHK